MTTGLGISAQGSLNKSPEDPTQFTLLHREGILVVGIDGIVGINGIEFMGVIKPEPVFSISL